MAALRILSAGAAQSVVEHIAREFERDTGHGIEARFGAVGAMAQKVIAGESADVVILTDKLIDELTASGMVAPGSRADLGYVGTGVAVRAGTPLPDVSSARVLRGNMLAAAKIVCPDPAIATAGKVVMALLERLGIADEVRPRMQFFPNGYAAMAWLAASMGTLEMGITQITEIRANKGVKLAGPLPGALQARTLYSAGLAARAPRFDIAQSFVARLTALSSRKILTAAGFEE
ncbi:MAG TPA: substrate-binding domain-containing protein [Burkholderiales bacterium]|nr:substrate-binding domain-containing protein [Burkholderiales bacterium]